MNTEQLRAEFESVLGRSKTYNERDFQMFLLGRRAALQSQDREDAERLDWLERHDGWFYNLGRIACVVGAGFRGTEQDVWHPSLREAIDHARRGEGGGND